MRKWIVGLTVVLILAWFNKAWLVAQYQSLITNKTPAKKGTNSTVVYVWTDDKGVTHMGTKPEKGGKKITLHNDNLNVIPAIEPIKTVDEASASTGDSGNELLNTRKELQKNVEKIQKAKSEQSEF